MAPAVEFLHGISREAINELAVRRYEGEVRLVATPEDLERAAADFAAERVVGFDTETRPAFRAGQHYPPALVQVATARAVYLFQLARIDCSSVLAALLGSPATVKAGGGLPQGPPQLPPVFHFTPPGARRLGRHA